MFAKRSIRKEFLFQLIFASISLILIFSSILYFYIENSIYEEKNNELIQYAKNVLDNKAITQLNDETLNQNFLSLNLEMLKLKTRHKDINIYEKTEKKKTYLTMS